MTTTRRYAAVLTVMMAAGFALPAGQARGEPMGFSARVQCPVLGSDGQKLDLRAGSIAVADFNGDGQIDVALPGIFIAGVGVILNGGYQGPWFSTGSWPVAVVAADFNADGHVDLAVAERDGGGVSIYTNDGSGVFSRAGFYATGAGPSAVVAADMDKDGRPDLVVVNRFSETVSVLHNTGGGFVTWQTVPVSGEPNALAVADLDNNGWPDVAVACASDDTVKVLRNTGGVLLSPVAFDAGPYPVAVAAADLNNDGFMDLAVADREAPQVTVLMNDGAGHFAAHEVAWGTDQDAFDPPLDVQLIDDNADGAIDIYSAGKVFLNDGAGNFRLVYSATSTGAVYAKGFVPGNPNALLCTATRDTSWYNWVTVTYQAPPAPLGTVAGDIDGDGHVDVIDLLTFVSSWGRSNGQAGYLPRCDLDGNGSVDVLDLLYLIATFGA